MEVVQSWRTALTRSSVGTIVLAGAFLTHVALNLTKLALQIHLADADLEAVQIALGLSIPVLLVYHASYMRSHHLIDGSETPYFETLPGIWNNGALQQSALLLLVWTHGCIGLHYGFGSGASIGGSLPCCSAWRCWSRRWRSPGSPLPGARRPTWRRRSRRSPPPPTRVAVQATRTTWQAASDAPAKLTAADVRFYATGGTCGRARSGGRHQSLVRTALRLTHRRIRVTYTAGPSITAPSARRFSRSAACFGVPHASVCGGRARCSTCRVKVERQRGEHCLRRVRPRRRRWPHPRRGRRPPRLPDSAAQSDLSVTRLVRPPEKSARARSRPVRRKSAWSGRSPSSSSTSAASPRSARRGSPTTRCSCSTASSPRPAKRSPPPAAGSTSIWATE